MAKRSTKTNVTRNKAGTQSEASKISAGTKQSSDSGASRSADRRIMAADALLRLAAERPYDEIGLLDIASEADMTLATLREMYPSKGAILGTIMRRTDLQVLANSADDMLGESAHDRVLDVMMRRFDALMPHRESFRSIHAAFRNDLLGSLALNGAALNSWRFMLEAAGIPTDGPGGALRVQGAAVVFWRAMPVWFDDEPDLSRTMALLDRELRRGGKMLGMADAVARLAAPFRGFMRAACERRSSERAA